MVSDNESVCPVCGGELRYLETVQRIVRTDFGRSHWIDVERVICMDCGRKHRVTPNTMLPYKQYEAKIINGFISGEYSSFDLEFEDYPCENTIKLWLKAFK